jgi:hypothetical protein
VIRGLGRLPGVDDEDGDRAVVQDVLADAAEQRRADGTVAA